MKRKDRTFLIIVFLLPSVFLYCLFVIYPYIKAFYISLFNWSGLSLYKDFVGLENFSRLFRDPVFWTALKNNLFIWIIGGSCIVGLTLFFSLVISNRPSSASIYRTAFFFPYLISLAAVAVLWSFIYNPTFGLLNSVLRGVGLESLTHAWLGETRTALPAVTTTIIWYSNGFYLILFLSAISNIPPSLIEAAKVDGASLFQRAVFITIPLIREIFKIAIVYITINTLNIFDVIYVMTVGGPNRRTEVLATYMYEQAFRNSDFGYGTAISVMLFLFTIVISVFLFRLLTKETLEY